MSADEIREWQLSQKRRKLPYSTRAYFAYRNICPACQRIKPACPHCRGEGTYNAYMTALQGDQVAMYREAVDRSLELSKIIASQQKQLALLKEELEKLHQNAIPTEKETLTNLIVRIENELKTLDTQKIPKPAGITLGKIFALMQQMKESLHGKSEPPKE